MIEGPLGIWKFPILNRIISRAKSATSQSDQEADMKGENNNRVVVVKEVEQVEGSTEETQIQFPSQEGRKQSDRAIPVEDETRDETVFIEEKDVTLNTRVDYHPSSEDVNGVFTRSPIHGQGVLKSFLVIVDSPEFEAFVEIDNEDVVREPITELISVSNELDSISAYKDGDSYVFTISEYPFQQFLGAGVRPTDTPITVQRIRMEVEK